MSHQINESDLYPPRRVVTRRQNFINLENRSIHDPEVRPRIIKYWELSCVREKLSEIWLKFRTEALNNDPQLAAKEKAYYSTIENSKKKNILPKSKKKSKINGKSAVESQVIDDSSNQAVEEKITIFEIDYKITLEKLRMVELYEEAQKSFPLLFHLYEIVKSNGGYEEVFQYNLWDNVLNSLKTQCPFEENTHVLKQTYNKFLFQYAISKHKSNINTFLNPNLLYGPKIYEKLPKQKETTELFYNNVLEMQCCVLKNFEKIYSLDKSLFTLKHIKKNHGNDVIDIIVQNPTANSIKAESKQQACEKIQDKISNYIDYVDSYIRDSESKIKFAVNIDVTNWKEIIFEFESKMPSRFLYKSSESSLSYLRQEIGGISSPQLYLKVFGCWTGGHQENLNLRSININHGPGDCEWYAIESNHVPEFRKKAKEKFNIDIHKNEGLWFADIITLISLEIPIMKFIQKPGDIVLLGPGCLHWVRAKDKTVNSSWNFATNNWMQFEKIYERAQINKEINFLSIIPYQTLTLDAINLVSNQFNKEDLNKLLDKLEIFIKIQSDLSSLIEANGYVCEEDDININNVLLCETCNTDTFVYWASCILCGEGYPLLICANCAIEHSKKCKDKAKMVFYQKYKFQLLNELIKIRRNGKMEPLCELAASSFYVGQHLVNLKKDVKNSTTSNPKNLLKPPEKSSKNGMKSAIPKNFSEKPSQTIQKMLDLPISLTLTNNDLNNASDDFQREPTNYGKNDPLIVKKEEKKFEEKENDNNKILLKLFLTDYYLGFKFRNPQSLVRTELLDYFLSVLDFEIENKKLLEEITSLWNKQISKLKERQLSLNFKKENYSPKFELKFGALCFLLRLYQEDEDIKDQLDLLFHEIPEQDYNYFFDKIECMKISCQKKLHYLKNMPTDYTNHKDNYSTYIRSPYKNEPSRSFRNSFQADSSISKNDLSWSRIHNDQHYHSNYTGKSFRDYEKKNMHKRSSSLNGSPDNSLEKKWQDITPDNKNNEYYKQREGYNSSKNYNSLTKRCYNSRKDMQDQDNESSTYHSNKNFYTPQKYGYSDYYNRKNYPDNRQKKIHSNNDQYIPKKFTNDYSLLQKNEPSQKNENISNLKMADDPKKSNSDYVRKEPTNHQDNINNEKLKEESGSNKLDIDEQNLSTDKFSNEQKNKSFQISENAKNEKLESSNNFSKDFDNDDENIIKKNDANFKNHNRGFEKHHQNNFSKNSPRGTYDKPRDKNSYQFNNFRSLKNNDYRTADNFHAQKKVKHDACDSYKEKNYKSRNDYKSENYYQNDGEVGSKYNYKRNNGYQHSFSKKQPYLNDQDPENNKKKTIESSSELLQKRSSNVPSDDWA